MKPFTQEQFLESFWRRVEKTDGCWIWHGCLTNGYGRIGRQKHCKHNLAHRFAYELIKGQVPLSMSLDHLCRNRRCVNPDHLEPVTLAENVLRGVGITATNARKTHCKHGHELTDDNVVLQATRGHAFRRCRTCKRRHDWNRRQKKTEAVK